VKKIIEAVDRAVEREQAAVARAMRWALAFAEDRTDD
jgi:hypothetical protein